jgi:predicted DNA-binding ArsR family transcriptional regulator
MNSSGISLNKDGTYTVVLQDDLNQVVTLTFKSEEALKEFEEDIIFMLNHHLEK